VAKQLVLIDVREPWEHQLCRIEGARLVPLGSLAASLQALPDVDEVILLLPSWRCAVWTAAAWLRFQGIEKASRWLAGLNGGLFEVDPKVSEILSCWPPQLRNEALPKMKIKFLQKPT